MQNEKLYQCRYCRKNYIREHIAKKMDYICPLHSQSEKLIYKIDLSDLVKTNIVHVYPGTCKIS